MKSTKKKLRVVHYPQIGSGVEPFKIDVRNEREAYLVYNALANQHLYLYENNFMPDYSNVICVECLEDGDWEQYYNEREDMYWHYLLNEYEDILK